MKIGALLIALLAGLALVSAAVALALHRSPSAEANPYRGTPAVRGFRMPEFTLRDQRGETLRSSALREKVTLLTFLDSQCTDACPVIAVDRTYADKIDYATPTPYPPA